LTDYLEACIYSTMVERIFLSYVAASLAIETFLTLGGDLSTTAWLSMISACLLILTSAIWTVNPAAHKSRRSRRYATIKYEHWNIYCTWSYL